MYIYIYVIIYIEGFLAGNRGIPHIYIYIYIGISIYRDIRYKGIIFLYSLLRTSTLSSPPPGPPPPPPATVASFQDLFRILPDIACETWGKRFRVCWSLFLCGCTHGSITSSISCCYSPSLVEDRHWGL